MPETTPPRLTVAMVVRNDADALSQSLRSIAAIADEMIVVDTGSTDNSREVAAQFGCQVIEFLWSDDFSAARNAALPQITSDWILWLYAGETLDEADATDLRRSIMAGQLNSSTAYVMIIKPPAAQGVIAAEQVARLRLIPNTSGIRFQGRVRESLYETLENLGIDIDGLPFRILRGTRENDAALKRRRAQRNLHLADLEISEQGRTPTLINCQAEAAQTLGNTERAVALYTETLELDTQPSNERLEAYYGLLTCLDAMPDARATQLSLCVKALEEFPLDAQLLCAMGGYLQADNRVDLAARSYQTACEFGHVNPLVWHLDEITAIAAVCHSAVLQAQGDDDAALDVLQNAIVREGNSPRIRRALLELHIKSGRQDAALQQVKYVADETTADQLALAVEGACLASGQQWDVGQAKLEQAYATGCRDAVCFRWLTLSFLACEQLDAAGQVLTAWRDCHPADPDPIRIGQAVFGATPEAAAGGSNRRIDLPGNLTGSQAGQAASVRK